MIRNSLKYLPLIIVAAMGIIVWIIFKPSYGKVVVKNLSDYIIDNGSINVCRQQYIISELKPGEERVITFPVKGESDYNISLHLSSGKTLKRTLGYTTAGYTNDDILEVSNNDVSLKETNRTR